ncbi:acyl carrier protein [Halomonas urmiana]|uniref:Acyl carrier protein n=1 Tax=Halomonas urmiana TaxID=490901 RepID=A0A5R8MIY1_9GAMM|nr:acyl carrier protein [Halomonas urmiana]TLF51812.1 acyl carrier protein [Halomonas urmiana]
MSREQILSHVQHTLMELFEVSSSEVSPEARLYEDLDIDSIDAVDLVVELKRFTGRRIDPEAFKVVRSIDDVVDAVESLMRA